jgi:hypothetical protein
MSRMISLISACMALSTTALLALPTAVNAAVPHGEVSSTCGPT